VLRTPSFTTDQMQWDTLERTAPALDIRLIAVPVAGRSDLENAFAALRRDRPDALFGSNSAAILILRKQIAEFAAQERLPAMYPFTEVTEAGGLMSYGASRNDLFHRAASYVVKILNGAPPANMPIEQPTKFELVINLKAASTIGVTLPREALLLADSVIE
jgi:putative ABC transport system substrate-binding protein